MAKEVDPGRAESLAIRNSEFYPEARRRRGEYKAECLQLVCERAEAYKAAVEARGTDGAANGRASQRADELVDAINEAHDAFAMGPITLEEIARVERSIRANDGGRKRP